MRAHWLRSPQGVAQILCLAIYIAFLLFDSSWTLQVASAIDWVGGAVVVVGPVVAGLTAWQTQTMRGIVLDASWSRGRPWELTRLTFVSMALRSAMTHVLVLVVATGIALATGARGNLLPGSALRQVFAIVAFAAVGHVMGIVVRSRLAPAFAAVGTFLIPWFFYSGAASDAFIFTGGSGDLGRAPLDNWRTIGPQIALWGALALIAGTMDVLGRRPGLHRVAALALGVVLAALGSVGVASAGPASYLHAEELRVKCEGTEPVLCLSRETERGRSELTAIISGTRAAVLSTGVDPTLFERVIEHHASTRTVVGSNGAPMAPAPGDLLVPVTDEMLVRGPNPKYDQLLIQFLTLPQTCDQDRSRWDSFESYAWLASRTGVDPSLDYVAAEVDALGPAGKTWLRDSFTGMLTCAPGVAPPVPGTP